MRNKICLGNTVICSSQEYYGLKNDVKELQKDITELKDRSKNHRFYADRQWDLRWTMEIVDMGKNISAKIDIIDFLVKAIKNDIKYEYISKMFYYGGSGKNTLCLLPLKIKIKSGKEINAEHKGWKQVSLKEDTILTIPEQKGKLCKRVIEQKNIPFVNDTTSQKAKYYEPLGICTVVNGRHSTAAGIIYEKGEIEAEVIDISPLFKYMHTDGENWINTNTSIGFTEVQDFRVAIIYELVRMKHELLKNN